MVKGLVFKGPRGYNLLAEVDYFYPLPDSVAALKPKRTKLKAVTAAPATPEPPPPPAQVPLPYHSIDDHENHILFNHELEQHPALFVPVSGWRNDPNLAQISDVPAGKEVPDTNAKDRIWTSPGFTVRLSYPPRIPLKIKRHFSQFQLQHFDPKLLFQPQQRTPMSQPYWVGQGPATAVQWPHKQPPLQLRRIDTYARGRSMSDNHSVAAEEASKSQSDWTKHEDWEHFGAHRDRRDLYTSLEGMMYVAERVVMIYGLR